ncbi:MAG: WG repeat-containing protein [Cyclobacteriaceae bacterium]|nr:WG repeat-containing protein [Cyclobacteriaceae bacterium]
MKLAGLLFIFVAFSSSLLASDYQRFEENGKVGLKDSQGAVVLPASFDALGWSDGNFSLIGQITGYRQNNRWGLLNLKKEFITKAEFTTLTWPGSDRIIVSQSVNSFTIKFGCIDLQGKQIIPIKYDAIDIHSLRAIVMNKNGVRYEYGLIDLNDRSILPMKFKKITPIGSLRYAVMNFSDKIALCSEEGKWVTDFIIDHISDFHHDLAIIHQGWKQGVIDRTGDIKVLPQYRAIHIIGPDHITVRKADEWKLMNEKFHDLQRIPADELIYNNEGLYRITLNNKSGLVSDILQPRWPLDYDYIGPVNDQQAIVKKDGKFGLLRLNQTAVIPIAFDSLCTQQGFVRTMKKSGGKSSWELYDTFGIRKTNKSYDFMDRFNGKFFPVKNRGHWGAVDRYGKEQIACVYDSLLQHNDSLVTIIFKGNYGIITLQDQWRMPPQKNPIQLLPDNHYLEKQDSLLFLKDISGNTLYFTDHQVTVFEDHLVERLSDGTEKEISFQGQIISRKEPVIIVAERTFRESEGLIGIKRDGKFGFVDNRGRLRIANRYEGIGEFHDGLAPIQLLGKWGYINKSDEIIIQPTYEFTGNFEEKVALVSRKSKFGMINSDGKELLELRYDSIKKITSQLFLLTLGRQQGLADTQGRILIEPRFDAIEVINDEQVMVLQNKKFGVLTKDGMNVLPIQYTRLIHLPARKSFVSQQKSSWETILLK